MFERVRENLSRLLIPVQNTIGNIYELFPTCDCFLRHPEPSFFSQGNTRLSQSAKISSAKRFTKREFAPVQQQSLVALPVTRRHVTALWDENTAPCNSPVSCLRRAGQTLTPLRRSAKQWKLCQCLKNLTAIFQGTRELEEKLQIE